MITINPVGPNLNAPPPPFSGDHRPRFRHPNHHGFHRHGHHGQFHGHRQNFNNKFHTPFRPFHKNPIQDLDPDFDGKKLRKSSMRKTIDYNAAVINALEV